MKGKPQYQKGNQQSFSPYRNPKKFFQENQKTPHSLCLIGNCHFQSSNACGNLITQSPPFSKRIQAFFTLLPQNGKRRRIFLI